MCELSRDRSSWSKKPVLGGRLQAGTPTNSSSCGYVHTVSIGRIKHQLLWGCPTVSYVHRPYACSLSMLELGHAWVAESGARPQLAGCVIAGSPRLGPFGPALALPSAAGSVHCSGPGKHLHQVRLCWSEGVACLCKLVASLVIIIEIGAEAAGCADVWHSRQLQCCSGERTSPLGRKLTDSTPYGVSWWSSRYSFTLQPARYVHSINSLTPCLMGEFRNYEQVTPGCARSCIFGLHTASQSPDPGQNQSGSASMADRDWQTPVGAACAPELHHGRASMHWQPVTGLHRGVQGHKAGLGSELAFTPQRQKHPTSCGGAEHSLIGRAQAS